jgi:heat-inducible transcriptional repressor
MELDRRKQTLLQAVVVTYVQRAEPVASQALVAQQSLGVRSATIRNELAEMTDLGYLRQPHTSAGRVPSDLGYRYYVDHLMRWDPLAPADARAIRSAHRMSEGDVEQLLVQTCRVLSSLTGYTAVASPPAAGEPVVRQVHLVQVAAQQLLAVVVLDNGQVIHRFTDVPQALTPAQVTRLSNLLDEQLRDLPARRIADASLPAAQNGVGEDVVKALLGVISRGVAGEEGELFVEGASHMLEHPEFREADRVEPLVRFLEERKNAYEALRKLLGHHSLAVSIGQENPWEAMHEVSLVAASYGTPNRQRGWVALVGPTRMHYEHAVSAVQFAAKALSEALSRAGW